jgi:hypothetical protein
LFVRRKLKMKPAENVLDRVNQIILDEFTIDAGFPIPVFAIGFTEVAPLI